MICTYINQRRQRAQQRLTYVSNNCTRLWVHNSLSQHSVLNIEVETSHDETP
jgi:hypothetical protein